MSGDDLGKPLILTVAPNGARKTKADHPALPMTAAEIARPAAACAEAGAAMIHLHVRDKAGAHLLDAEAYRAATAAIRREAGPDIVVQITTEAVDRYTPAEQMAVVRDCEPEAVSLALRELCPDPDAEPAAAEFFGWLHERGILAQYILYAEEEIARFDDLLRRGVIPGGTPFLLFVLGRYTRDQTSLPRDLLPFVEANRADHAWMACAFGARETACAVAAAALGGHARVGFENNLFLPAGIQAADNAALVAAAARGIAAIGRPLAAATAARGMMAGRQA